MSLDKSIDKGIIITPNPEFVEKANLGPKEYERLTKWAEDDFEGFWDYFAKNEIAWLEPYKSVLNDSNAPFFKFFEGGKLNMCYNCVDRHVTTRKKNRAAIIWENERGDSRILTYRELQFQVNKFANVLKTLGTKKGDVVIIYMPMIPELPIAMLACAKIGAIHSVVFAGLSANALKERIVDAEARIVITADGGYRGGKTIPLKVHVDDAVRELKQVKYVVVARHIHSDVPMKTLRDFWWQDLMSDSDYANPHCEAEAMDSEDPLFIMYTSGSTGKPKGVVHSTAGYLIWRILTARWVFDLKEEDTFWSTANIGWISGHSYTLYGPLSIGSTTFLFEGIPTYPSPDQWWYLVEKYRINVMYTAPTAIRALMRYGESYTKNYDLSSLRLLTTGGERLNEAAWLWYYENVGSKKCPIIDAYGQTETAGHMISSLPVVKQKPGSVGIPVPGIFPDIVDDKGEIIKEPNKRGFLVLKKPWPSMVRTLWKNDEDYIKFYWEKFNNKYYYTSDMAYKDKDGYFWMEGRSDDVINVSAHRIGCSEVESALTSCSMVTEAAVVGKPNEITGEEVFAFVVLKKDVDKTKHDEIVRKLRDYVRDQVSPIAKPSEIVFVDSLPKTRSGKVMRRVLKDIAAGKEIHQDLSTLEDKTVLDKLKDAVENRELDILRGKIKK